MPRPKSHRSRTKPGLRVNFPRRLAEKFKSEAKKHFKTEEYAILLGEVDPDGTVNIEDIYMPEDRLAASDHTTVPVTGRWFQDAQKLADAQGLHIVGDIHSHCFSAEDYAVGVVPSHEPSESDWASAYTINQHFARTYTVFGICRVYAKDTKKRATMRFWPVQAPITTKIS